jgi:hypothetical protein
MVHVLIDGHRAGDDRAWVVIWSPMFDVIMTLRCRTLQTGRLRTLALSSLQRSPLAPRVPTIAESGYPASRR